MVRIEFQETIKSSAQNIYQASQDYAVRYEWDPFPENIVFLHGATAIAKGVSVVVTAKVGMKMVVEFIQVDPPKTASVTMITGPFFLKAFSGSWIFKPLSEFETKAKFVYSIRCKWWFIPFISEPMISWYFAGVVKSRLMGLKTYCEQAA